MAFRMRKSIKVAPGVKVNVSKRGVGAFGRREGRPVLSALLWAQDRLCWLGCCPRRLLPEERLRQRLVRERLPCSCSIAVSDAEEAWGLRAER
jgi:hypothetical protein